MKFILKCIFIILLLCGAPVVNSVLQQPIDAKANAVNVK